MWSLFFASLNHSTILVKVGQESALFARFYLAEVASSVPDRYLGNLYDSIASMKGELLGTSNMEIQQFSFIDFRVWTLHERWGVDEKEMTMI